MHPNAETLTNDELALVQNQAWAGQSAYVLRNSAFYQALWGDQKPGKHLRDLPELPLSDKAGLRLSQAALPPFGDYLATDRSFVKRLHRTSGTTGQAMNLAMSARDCDVNETVAGRCQAAAGLKAGHTVVHCLNYQMWMGGLTDHLGLERTGATVIPFGVGNTELLIRTILDVGVTAISCTPSYPAVIARVLDEKFPSLKPVDLGLKLGLFGGEAGLDDPRLRDRLRAVWGLEPRNSNYGVSDVFCNFAGQCEHDSRLHFLASDVLYPELIDPATCEPIAIDDGASGELVLTHLERDCQPLVRFRTGDIIAIDATDPCACGRTGFRFRVVGRSDDMVVVRGLNLFPTMVAAVLAAFPDLSGDYRINLDTPPPYDALPVQVELAKNAGEHPGLALDVAAAIKKNLGASAHVTVRPSGSFPTTDGKTARVIRSFI
ncbi:MAG: phenylacetate--CoA ligase family protein [Rhodobacterales bacterium]|jgi:phenylacetate-CoA ligase|nr:phenylacetate--CoA ligase family protein [Pseudomonadota bacterium]MDA1285206.1 phenylacetate--CoA ligase family protein [Pseudomonadota bacterium]NQW12871.1 phenylacetate--CoA ligase family protein [Rhodobacter sp.]